MAENNVDSAGSSDQLPPFPKLHWILLFFGLWLLCGVTPAILVYVGTNYFSIADSQLAAVAGTIGDAFGLANSLFTGAALLFVIWSLRLQQQEIHFARQEWQQNTRAQKEQALMMKESASLTAINHIYNHYSSSYGMSDATGILAAVAAGHRRWAIRESFGSIDSVFNQERVSQVDQEVNQLAKLLSDPKPGREYLKEVAIRTSSLLIDIRVSEAFRRTLWPIYEILRADPQQLCSEESILFSICFSRAAQAVVDEWKLIRGESIEVGRREQGARPNGDSTDAPSR
jgi:hypothetical protein